jgi:hypothetical protein
VGGKLLLGDFDHFAAFILSAFGADPMGQLALVAVGTLGKTGGFESIVRAAGGCALRGVSTFGIRHFCTSII